MPQHPGFEPFMFVWVIQAEVNQVLNGKITATFLKVNLFTTEQGYSDWKAWLRTQTAQQAFIYNIRTDYGLQKWYNDRVWIQQQMSDMFINGNWIPNLLP
jgi:hypothetical protein